jgi:hypothetical protein
MRLVSRREAVEVLPRHGWRRYKPGRARWYIGRIRLPGFVARLLK